MTPFYQPLNIPAGDSGARYRPQREEITITWRGSHGYLPGQEQLPLCRLRYLGSDTDWLPGQLSIPPRYSEAV